MTTSAQTASLAAALLSTRQPCELATSLLDPTSELASGAGGYPVATALTALVSMELREHGPGRTARIVWDTTVLTDAVQLAFGADTVSYDGSTASPADTEAFIDGVIAAMVADSAVNAIASGSREGTDTLVIRWRARVATGLAFTRTSGTGTYTCTLEYESATWRIYSRSAQAQVGVVLTDPTAARASTTSWQDVALGSVPASVEVTDGAGWRQGADVGGVSALAFLAEDLTGHADDASVGTASGVTTAYRTPVAWAAPGIQSAT